MHKENIVHRDLKPENILLHCKCEECFDVKISDFGFSCMFDPKEELNVSMGTLNYMAPEMIRFKGYTEKVDIWSVGVIAFQLLTGNNPFNAIKR